MMKRLIFLFMFLFILPLNANALVCDNKQEVKYQQLAQNISYSYDYKEENNKVSFSITFTNVKEKLYLKNLDTNQVHKYTGSEIVIGNIVDGKSYKYGAYTSELGCNGIKLFTYYINIPFYNPYYNDSLCKGVEEFKYCNKWFNKRISYEEFSKNVNEYKQSLEKEEVVDKEISINSFFDVLFNFYLKYYYIILPLIIISLLMYIRYHNKKNDLF